MFEEFLDKFVYTDEVTLYSASFRLVVSLFLGFCIGFERQIRRRDAGMRTFTLMSLGATLAMLVSIWIPQSFPHFLNGDPGRISAQVISGVGFLGAGAIIHGGGSVQGLTTAACIWIMSVIGLAVGAGMFVPAIVATVLSMFILISMEKIEKRMFINGVNKFLKVTCKTVSPDDVRIRELIEQAHMAILSQSFEYDYENNQAVLTYKVNVRATYSYSKLFGNLNSLGYISQISLLS